MKKTELICAAQRNESAGDSRPGWRRNTGRPAQRTAPLDRALDFSLTAWRPVVLRFLLPVTLLLLFLHLPLLSLLQLV